MTADPASRSRNAGWREVGGRRIYFRSMWEANFGRYLQWLQQLGEIDSWEHEPETFWFEAVRRGTRSYLPDFRVLERNSARTYYEVKGYMTARNATALARMKRYYPRVRLILIDGPAYAKLARQVAALVPGWEREAPT